MEFMLTEGQKMLIKGSMENGLIVGRSFHLSDNSFLKEENPEDWKGWNINLLSFWIASLSF